MKMLCVFALMCLHVASAQSSARGVKIKSQKASVELGVKGDVALRRAGTALKIEASYVQAAAFKVGNVDLDAYIEAAVRKRIKPQIKECKPGFYGPFCDQPCKNADPKTQVYTSGCTAECKKGFVLLKGKCSNQATAPCNIENSNKKPGKSCQCLPFFPGTITWKGSVPTGQCEACGVVSGFNADLVLSQTVMNTGPGWKQLTNWRTNSNNELYENGNEFDEITGRFAPKNDGYFLCNANVRLDSFNGVSSALLVSINGKTDKHGGLYTIEGNGGSTNYRSMMVSGTLQVKKGQFVSVSVYSSGDNYYRVSTESGFSCHQLETSRGFHADNSNNQKITTVRKWVQLTDWRVKGAAGLYNAGDGFSTKTSKYTSPNAGIHYCYAMIRMDKASKSGYIALNLAVNDKGDGDNGFHVIRGNKDSSNYGSLNLAGTVYLKKGDTTSLVVYSSVDSDFTVHSESGWGCHHFASNIGFHATVSQKQTFGRMWSRVAKWSTAGNNELYAMGGAAVSSSGFFVAPVAGFYACAAQVQITSDTISYSYFRVGLFINGQTDYNNGMHTIDGNQASTNYRSMRVAGIVKLEKSNTISVNVYSSSDASWTLNKQSGFSCNRLKGRPPCPECKIANSNMARGKDCACKAGYTGTIKWLGNVPSGTCKPAPCNIPNSNKLPGPLCKCKDGYTGELSWTGAKVSGTCKAAACTIPGSNMQPGAACKCLDFYSGSIVWKGAVATGSCNICGSNSGFNADLKSTISVKTASYFEITTFATTGNNELYETSENEFNNGKFAPKRSGYYQCNANVRLDGVSNEGMVRLIVAVQNTTKDKKKNATYAGLISVDGNAGADDYRSLLITGTVAIKKGQYVSVFVHSSKDNKYKIRTESGFSCHRFNTMEGFHATKAGTTNMPRSWTELKGWSTAGVGGVYNVGGGFDGKTGRYTAPVAGHYYCGAVLRLDGASSTSMFRLNLCVNKQYDYSNGMHALRGYQGSTNYASVSVAGTLQLMKGQYVSLVTYSSTDNSYQVNTDSMWGCHRMEPKVGFHADLSSNEAFKNGWNVVTRWRTTLNNELYAVGGAKLEEGVFAAPEAGYYACATQVRVEYTNYSPGKSVFRLILSINNQKDVNNGFGTTESNRQQQIFRRSMRVGGSMFLKKGDKVSVQIYSQSIKAWTANTESGFSCHKFTTHLVACPKCNAPNSNKLPGPACKCLPGFKGSVTYNRKLKSYTGTCAKAKCTIKNSNKQDGEKCKCLTHYTGEITWDDTGAKGTCTECGAAKGFNADLLTSIYQTKPGWREITLWRTNLNNELYQTDGSLDGSKGRFAPNQEGYYLCNANVRLDSFLSSAEARLNIGINGKPDEVNGLSVAEGNGGSTNYRSLTISGTLKLKKTDFASVFAFSKGDNTYYIRSDSGFSCQLLHSPYGFHASKNGELKLKKKGWHEVGNWRVAGPAGLYSAGKAFNVSTGQYSVTAASAGVHYCYAMLRIDGADKGKLFRLSLNLNNALDNNNGFHAVRGNKDSKNFGSSNVAGSVKLKKGDKMSVYVYAQSDDNWRIATESGWGCHKLGSNIGFHASGSKDVKFRNSYSRLTGWRTKGNKELYNHGGPGVNAQGYYQVPADGYYVCATQVRIDNAHSVGYFRLLMSINGQIDSQAGFSVMDGNQGSDNYRSMRVAGLVPLKAGNTVSVMVYSQNDLDWTFSKESGFSCNKIFAKSPCAACNIPFSNKVAGPGCACKQGYTGKITWKDGKPAGVCKPVACTVKNSNNKAGPECACADGYQGKVTWKNNKPTGTCVAAQCKVENSNKKPGKQCKCKKPYIGNIRWIGPTAVGPCNSCGTNSGFNADLRQDVKGVRFWQELGNWRTNANTELYETNSEFDGTKGRFTPKSSGYFLCNANIAFQSLSSAGTSRLLLAVNKVGVKTPLKDVNNGLAVIEGNGGSTTWRSMTVAGVLQIKDGEFVSVFFYSSFDSIFTIKHESGFSCHKFSTKFGFHADKLNTETLSMKSGWVKIQNWRDSGSLGLYNTGGGFDRKTGVYSAPASGAYFCSALLRLDYASRSAMFVLSLNVDDKPETDHGLSSVRGNRGSSNYGTMGVAGSIYLKKGQDISLYAYSSNDNFFRVTTEAGWGCHQFGTGVGFHADMATTQTFTQSSDWARLGKWRTAGNNELYAQGSSLNAQGYFQVPESGYYMCAAQVRIDTTYTNSLYRMIIAINNEMDINNGLHVTDSNIGYTNYRSLKLAGSVYLKKGDTTSVAIKPPATEKSWKVHSASGFSCHMFTTKQPCKDAVPRPTEPKPKKTTQPKKTTKPKKTEAPTKPQIADGARPFPKPPVADGGISIGGR